MRSSELTTQALTRVTTELDQMDAADRQYDNWCSRHGYRRGSFAPGAMARMRDLDHAEALAMDVTWGGAR